MTRTLQPVIIALLMVSGLAQAESPACTATPQSFLGNSYVPDVATYKKDVGKGLTIKGRVLSAKDCSPINHAVIERWQAGNEGTYEGRFRALMKPEADGSYQFETEWPNMTIPHIHFIVTAEGYEPLTTQWVPGNVVTEANFDLVLAPSN